MAKTNAELAAELTLANDRIAVLEKEVTELEDQIEEGDPESPKEAVGSWLERQSVLGFISPEGKKVVEQLLADL